MAQTQRYWDNVEAERARSLRYYRKKEIAKCEVVCANRHRIRTADRKRKLRE